MFVYSGTTFDSLVGFLACKLIGYWYVNAKGLIF